MILIFIVFTTGLFFTITVILLFLSPGEPDPFLDNHGKHLDGSISEKTFISIGGIKQGMIIKSKNQENPVLPYFHGGIPDYFLTQKYPTGLEDYFTAVWWDQRGSGLS